MCAVSQNEVRAPVAAIGTGIVVRNVSGSVVIANNAVYSNSGSAIALISGNLGLVTATGNVGIGGGSGISPGNGIAADFVAAHFNGAPPIDLFPKTGSALIGAGAAAHVPSQDFNGTARTARPTWARIGFRAAPTPDGL